MATNVWHEEGDQFAAPVAVGTVAGDPVAVGQLAAVALTNRDATTGEATVKTNGVFLMSVRGHNGTANTAIAVGDVINHTQADTPKLSVRPVAAGTIRWGTALQAVASGATATIRVKVGY